MKKIFNGLKKIKKLEAIFEKYRYYLSIIFIFTSIEALIPVIQVSILAKFVSLLLVNSNGAFEVYFYSILYITSYFLLYFIKYLKERLITSANFNWSLSLEERIMRKVTSIDLLQRLDPSFNDSFSKAKQILMPGQLLLFYRNLFEVLVLIITSLFLIVNLYFIHWSFILLISFILSILIPKIYKVNKSYMESLFKQTRENNVMLALEKSILTTKSFAEMKVFDHFNYLKNIYKQKYDDWAKVYLMRNHKIVRTLTIYNGALDLIPILLVLLLILFSIREVSQVILLFGTLAILLTNIQKFIKLISQVIRGFIHLFAAIDFMENTYSPNKYFEYKQQESGDVILKNVSLSYPNEDIKAINELNLTIPKGSKICIVGKNGSGKTSLVHLILKLFQPDEGTVTYSNEDCFVPQASALFQNYLKLHSTIRDNVSISNLNKATDELEICHALKKAQASFVFEKQLGLDCMLGREFGGIELSGGEWQRLCLARVFMKKEGLIILDEPTAKMDPLAEIDVYKSLLNQFKQNTIIFVSHRLIASVLADLIIVMDKGKIVEVGHHQELYEQKGLYYQMYSSQAKPYLNI